MKIAFPVAPVTPDAPVEQPVPAERPVTPPSRSWLAWMLTSIWRYKWLSVTAALLVAIAAYLGPAWLLGPRITGDAAIRGTFVQSIVASGRVEAPYRVDVGALITGIVVDVPVGEGETVKAGDTLVVLDNREALSAVLLADGAVAQAEARLRQVRELSGPAAEQAVLQARAILLNASKVHERMAILAAKGLTTTATLNEAEKALAVAEAQLRSAEFQLGINRPDGSDYAMAESQIAQARASLATAKSRLADTIVRAPRDGILISRAVERGSVVQAGKMLMQLSPAGEIQLVIQIDEKNLGLLRLGQSAIASADAFPKLSFAAVVSYINPSIDAQRAAVVVKLTVPAPPDYVRQDMTVSVDIEVARHDDAIILPAGDLRDLAKDSPWVLMAAGGRAKRQDLQVGLVSGGMAEIISGLAEGDLVIPPRSIVAEGDRVRVVAPVATAP